MNDEDLKVLGWVVSDFYTANNPGMAMALHSCYDQIAFNSDRPTWYDEFTTKGK